MILVDVYVPAIDQVYDFLLEESYCVAVIVKEVCEMIQQKEQISAGARDSDMVFFDLETKRMLPMQYSLEECGIKDGHRLILV